MSILEKLFPQQPEAPRDMVLRTTGSGDWVEYPNYSCGTDRMEWVGKDGSVRHPQPVTKKYSIIGGFHAAGKHYLILNQLMAQTDEYRRWCRDCYGREVFAIRERFPCFDSYDAMNEHRYYRWWFIRQGNVLTRIYRTDETNEIFVTEDVQDLEGLCWSRMQTEGYCCEK